VFSFISLAFLQFLLYNSYYTGGLTMEIRDILKQRRLDLNLTMKELADRIGVSEGTVSRWESGNIANMKRNMVTAYARALDISPSVIMGWDNSELEDGSSAREVFELSDFEKKLVIAFRNSDVQEAVCRLLNLDFGQFSM